MFRKRVTSFELIVARQACVPGTLLSSLLSELSRIR